PSRTYPLSLHDALPISTEHLTSSSADGDSTYVKRLAIVGETGTLVVVVTWRGACGSIRGHDRSTPGHVCSTQSEETARVGDAERDRKSTRLNSSHDQIS